MIKQSIHHKRGSTFSYSGLIKLPTGIWSAESEVHDASTDALVQTLTCTLSVLGSPGGNGETHSLLIEASAANTAAWPLNTKLKADILFVSGAVVVASDTFEIIPIDGVTDAG